MLLDAGVACLSSQPWVPVTSCASRAAAIEITTFRCGNLKIERQNMSNAQKRTDKTDVYLFGDRSWTQYTGMLQGAATH
jgi:hypothetical protein